MKFNIWYVKLTAEKPSRKAMIQEQIQDAETNLLQAELNREQAEADCGKYKIRLERLNHELQLCKSEEEDDKLAFIRRARR